MINAFPNKYAKPCVCCGCHVPVNEGFTASEQGLWTTYCRSSLCLPKPVYDFLMVRKLTKDGRVYMMYDEQAVPWLRQMPGAHFKRCDHERSYWQVSLDPAHRAQLLELAGVLKLDVAPELLEYDAPATTSELEVQAALERGKAMGAFNYQLAGIRFISERQRCLVGDQPGLGKSLMSLISIPSGHGTLAIVPASLKYNWAAECKRWRPDLYPRVLHGHSLPDVLWPPEGEVWIINPDSLPELPPAKLERTGRVFIICDEAHLYKNTRTKRHKAVRAWNAAATKVCIMTGTPMTNRPQDLWGTLAVAGLAAQAFGKRSYFESLFERDGKNELTNPSPEVPKRLRQVMLRRTQDEVLKELPPSVYKQHIVSKVIPQALAEKLDDLYERVEKALNMDRLPHLEDMSYVRSLLATFKITEMHELIEEYEEAELPLIVFSAHKEPVLSAAAREGWAAITGETKPEDRQAIVNAFQSGQLKGVALTVQAGGVGLTLTRAAHMLFVDLDWTPALNAQAEARIKRIGQKAERVHYTTMVVRHPVDERVLQLLEHKTRLFRESIDDVADEYKVPKSANAHLARPAPRMPYIDNHEQQAARIAANQAQVRKQLEHDMRMVGLKQAVHDRVPAIAALREVVAQERAKSQEAMQRRMAIVSSVAWLHLLRVQTPGFTFLRRSVSPDRLRLGLAHMLSRCDGAVAKDDVGFNAIDAQMARQSVYLDLEGNAEHAEVVTRLLSKYKRQLGAVVPELWEAQHAGHGGHAPSGV